jgi:hypothetical protein
MRRTERVAVELPVIWRRAGHEVPCTALDINEHGMFVGTDVVVEHGALMRIVIRLPDGDLEMFVTARYVGRTMRGQGIGAEIFLIDDVARERWIAFYRAQIARAATVEPARLAG